MKFLEEIMTCPHSEYKIKFDQKREGFVSDNNNFYPLVAGIPVFVDFADSYLWGQYLDVSAYLDKKIIQMGSLQEELVSKKLIASSKKRIERKIEGIEKELGDIQVLVNDSLIEFYQKHYGETSQFNEYEGVPTENFVFQYFFYIFRDWYWKTSENEKTIDVLKKQVQGEIGRTLVLGSGASRLAYDISKTFENEMVIATDLNYLFLHVAHRILNGEKFKMTWLPDYPRNLEHVYQEYETPAFEKSENLHFVVTDFYQNAFQDKSFDTIFVPWFLDVMELKLEDMLKKINRWLKPGGKLVYFGPYSFEKFGESNSYLPEEIKEIAENNGFAIRSESLDEIPYLLDLSNTQSRNECVLTFVAEKKKEAKIKEMRFRKVQKKLPLWLLHHDESIPESELIKKRKEVYKVFSAVYQKIDGKVTFDKLAKAFAKEFNMSASQAKAILEEHFKKVYKEELESGF